MIMKEKKEILNYLICGAGTTFINIGSYAFFAGILAAGFKTSTVFAGIISILFAFVANKFFVFNSMNKTFPVISRELGSFLLSRTISFGLDYFSMVSLVEVLRLDDMASKIMSNFLVILFNFLASKFFVFRQYAEHNHP